MKLTKRKTPSPASETHRRVQLEYVDLNARMVFVAGTFNEWRPDATEMVAMGAGRWWKELMLPPGEHQYRWRLGR
jgi:1,4-alpha-glucan branching enzyme